MDKKTIEKICYAIGFVILVGITMLDRYVFDIPSPVFLGLMVLAIAVLFVGHRASGRKLDWDFDFSPKGKTSRSRRRK